MAKRPAGKRRTGADGKVTVASKAANGEGSIYLDHRGVYRATYLDPTGKRRTASGRTKAEAAERRAAKLGELAVPSGSLGPAPTVAEVAAWWLADVAPSGVRPSTLHTYAKDAQRIIDGLGDVAMADLTSDRVRSWLAAMRRNGLAVATTTNARARLRQVANEAVELGYLRTNPVSRVPAPKATAEERVRRRVLTAEEARRLVAGLDGRRRFDAAVALLYTSGIRANEALGLAWSDLDLDAGTASIRRGCTYTPGIGPRLDRPKTRSTSGVHHLSPSTVMLLRRRRTAQAAERLAAGDAWRHTVYEGQPLDLVFTTATGGLPLRQALHSAVRSACKTVGIDATGVGTHTGRRSTVTALFVAGLSTEEIARHVGHSSTATTEGYVHDLGTRPADTAALAARLLDPAADAPL